MNDFIKYFRSDERGIGTVEFAIILPVLLLIFVGSNFLAEIVIVESKVSRAANALARIASMDADVTDAQWQSYRSMAEAILEPLPGNSTVTLTSVADNGAGLAVRWSDSSGSALSPGAPYTFPTGAEAYATSGKNTLVAQITLQHNSLLGRIWNSLPWAPFTFMENYTYEDTAYSLPLTYQGTGTDLWTTRTRGGVTAF